MKEFVEFLVKHLVDQPEEVKVAEVSGEHVTVYELRVASDDMGKLIGKKGRNAHAVRTLLNAVSAKNKGKRSILEILE